MCGNTGLYVSIVDNELIYYDSEALYNENSNGDASGTDKISVDTIKNFAVSIALMHRGIEMNYNDFNMHSGVEEYLDVYLQNLDYGSKINLSDMYEVVGSTIVDGDICYTVNSIDGESVTVRKWLLYEPSDGYYTPADSEDIPYDVSLISNEFIGYVEETNELSYYIGDNVELSEGSFYLNLNEVSSDGEIEVNFFGTRIIDTDELEPSLELRRLNPNDRFTWVLGETQEFEEHYVVSFRNEYSDSDAEIYVWVDGEEISKVIVEGMQ
jgi:hypothetical protein